MIHIDTDDAMQAIASTLVGLDPAGVLPHGPSKRYVDAFHLHLPGQLVMASHTVTAADTHDHFGWFRGVDQIEMMAQVAVVAPGILAEAEKQGSSVASILAEWDIFFLGVGETRFIHPTAAGDRLLAVGHIDFHRFHQIVAHAELYAVIGDVDLDACCAQLAASGADSARAIPSLKLVASCCTLTGKGLRKQRSARLRLPRPATNTLHHPEHGAHS